MSEPGLGERIAALTPEQRQALEQRLLSSAPTVARIEHASPSPPPQLSFGQERLWRLCQLMPGSAAYNMHNSYRLRGPLDVEALQAAVDRVIARNGSLRTVFSSTDGRPMPASETGADLGPIDLTTEADPLARIAAWADLPLDLSAGPLFRAQLWRLGVDDHVLSLLAHHLVCDGWSLRIIEEQLAELMVDGHRESSQGAVNYADFIAWERSREPSLRAALGSWSTTLADVQALRLPGQRADESGEVSFALSADVTQAIDELARSIRTTPFTVLLGIFASVLHRHTGQEDLVVCSPVAGRPDPSLEHVVGYFNDLVPVRISLAGDPEFQTILDRVRPAVLEALDRAVPFQWIAGLPGTRSTPLTHALFALNDVPAAALELPKLEVDAIHLPATTSDFELGWFMRAEGGRYQATVRYRSSSADTISALSADFVAIAESITGIAGSTLTEVPRPASQTAARPSMPVAVQPRSLLQSQLRQIWERVFERPIGVDDDFFDLGGHSLLAAELIGEIEEELSCGRIPLATLFAAPTVARMAELLEQEDWGGGWASLVPIKPSGARLPLFFVHGHGGNVIGFSDIGRNLSAEQPLYGLQAPRMDVDGGAQCIEDMARGYIEEMRTVQPAGPYLVGGWCLGGDIAFEMAQQLRQAGSEVALVLMVDNPRPEHIRTAPTSGPRRTINRLGTRLELEWSNLVEVPSGEQRRYVVERTARLGRTLQSAAERLATDRDGQLPLGLHHSRAYRQAKVGAMHEKAYETYRPRRYRGRVAVLRAAQQPWGRDRDPSLGWSALVDGPVMLYSLPGHRIGLLEGPRAPIVVSVMEEAIRSAREQEAITQP